VRVTISHGKSKDQVIKSVDTAFDDLFRGIGGMPVQLVQEKKVWNGSTLTFTVAAKMGFLSTPLNGTVEVTERDLTIDVDLGLLERFISPQKAKEVLETRVRGLLR
jgi:hypothetical protein